MSDIELPEIDSDEILNFEHEFEINETDLIVLLLDGSYVVCPFITIEKLIINPKFAEKLDDGFKDVDEFQEWVNMYFPKDDENAT
jgi:hypothetical protein